MLPPAAKPQNAADTIPSKHLHSSLNKIKHPVNIVRWTPEGRRLLTGSSSGEFTLWNGMAFNFETIMQVSAALRCINVLHRCLYSRLKLRCRHMTPLFEQQLTHTATIGSFRQTKMESSSTGNRTSTM